MNIVVTTYASDPKHPGFARLKRTAELWGWDFHPIIGRWVGFRDKLSGVRDGLARLPASTHILFVDAYDTVCCGPPSAAEPFCSDGVFYSCEKAIWPIDEGRKEQYEEYHKRFPPLSPWCHLNSGGYLANREYLLDVVLAGCDDLTDWQSQDDQRWHTNKLFSDSTMCMLDTTCSLFQTLAHTVVPWAPWDTTFYTRNSDRGIAPNRVRNKETETWPVWFHGNGGVWEQMGWLPNGEVR